MDEVAFRVRLEYRVCGELAGMRERRLRTLWCDGLISGEYHLVGPRPRINGRAWICSGRHQEEWDFTLLLPGPSGPQLARRRGDVAARSGAHATRRQVA